LPGLTLLGQAEQLSWGAQEPGLRGHRLALEVGRPVYQNLDGPQLEADWTATLGWQWLL